MCMFTNKMKNLWLGKKNKWKLAHRSFPSCCRNFVKQSLYEISISLICGLSKLFRSLEFADLNLDAYFVNAKNLSYPLKVSSLKVETSYRFLLVVVLSPKF